MQIIKLIHITCAALTFLSFFSRGILRYRRPNLLKNKVIKFLPHVIDTALLISAIGLLHFWGGWTVFAQPWLMTKIALLLIYIALGFIALNPKTKTPLSLLCWIVALAVFLFMVSVATFKTPFGVLVLL